MAVMEKPELNEDLLIHFGIKGMKWGRRRPRSDEQERKAIFKNADRKRKLIVGAAVVGGALAIGMLLSKRGRIKATDAAVTNYVQQRQARAQAGQNPFGQLAKKFRDTKAASVPSPDVMVAEARMAGVRNRVFKASDQVVVDQTRRNVSGLQRNIQDQGLGDLREVQRKLNDPSHVWEL
jgi:hypothetical protein